MVEYVPPSKAHMKRLKRARPEVVTSHKRKPIPQVKRRAFNRERDVVLDIVAILRPNFAAEKRLGAAKAFAHDKPECLALNIPPDCDEPRIAYWRRRCLSRDRLSNQETERMGAECGGLPLANGAGVMVL